MVVLLIEIVLTPSLIVNKIIENQIVEVELRGAHLEAQDAERVELLEEEDHKLTRFSGHQIEEFKRKRIKMQMLPLNSETKDLQGKSKRDIRNLKNYFFVTKILPGLFT